RLRLATASPGANDAEYLRCSATMARYSAPGPKAASRDVVVELSFDASSRRKSSRRSTAIGRAARLTANQLSTLNANGAPAGRAGCKRSNRRRRGASPRNAHCAEHGTRALARRHPNCCLLILCLAWSGLRLGRLHSYKKNRFDRCLRITHDTVARRERPRY